MFFVNLDVTDRSLFKESSFFYKSVVNKSVCEPFRVLLLFTDINSSRGNRDLDFRAVKACP